MCTRKTCLVVRNGMSEIYEYIAYVCDSRTRDIELLESVVYDMCHSKLISKMFYEPMKVGWRGFLSVRKISLELSTYKGVV